MRGLRAGCACSHILLSTMNYGWTARICNYQNCKNLRKFTVQKLSGGLLNLNVKEKACLGVLADSGCSFWACKNWSLISLIAVPTRLMSPITQPDDGWTFFDPDLGRWPTPKSWQMDTHTVYSEDISGKRSKHAEFVPQGYMSEVKMSFSYTETDLFNMSWNTSSIKARKMAGGFFCAKGHN